jgi:nickel-type superoxide dismutase maturation protease
VSARWRTAVGLAVAGYLAVVAINRSLVEVRGSSMEPVLWPGDRLLTVPAALSWLRVGQVVVVRDPGDPDHLVVKRLADVDRATVEVRGDDPDRSTDSRQWGRLPRSSVRRVALVRWPDVRSPLAHR